MKSMNKVLLVSSLAVLAILAGCGEKSIQYYAEHPDEAKQVVASCEKKGLAMLKDQNCVNAIEGNAQAVNKKARANDKREMDALKKQMEKNEKK